MKFLIDECLSPALVQLAVDAGHIESSHVVWRGLAGTKDRVLMETIVSGDWTLVTNNAVDFRGRVQRPAGHYSMQSLHAGLVCLNCETGFNLPLQEELFEVALAELGPAGELVNQVLEVTLCADGAIDISRYQLP